MAKREGKRRRRWWIWLLGILAVLGVAAYVIYGGGEHEGPGTVTAVPLPAEAVADRALRQEAMSEQFDPDERREAQILFGDLHVHTTFSADAFMLSLPLMGGEGAHPPADACDFARFCSGLDFFALTDHAESMSPQHWEESKESIRQCNAVAGDPGDPDLVAFIGWEWSQVGLTPEEHHGHRNVIFPDLDDSRLPTRPIGAPGMGTAFRRVAASSPLTIPLIPIQDFSRRQRYLNLLHYMRENAAAEACSRGVHVHDLPADCRETADTPEELFEKLDQWGFDALVIPHGTTWGFYTPPGYEWNPRRASLGDDAERQRLIEVFSGHGNSEEYRSWRAVELDANGEPQCPEPTEDFEPCCWRAGEIIRSRCGDASEAECERRVREARANYVAVGVAGHLTVPGATLEDWGDCGQCSDCFDPSFSYRPGGSVQAVLARGDFSDPEAPRYERLGFLASSDIHTARPGTGYKEFARRGMTEATGPESEAWRDRIFGEPPAATPESLALSPEELLERPGFSVLHLERQASFFLTGGLVAVHSLGRSREAMWDALKRREVYGTSGPRILLWFDLTNGPNGRQPMGSEVRMGHPPRFVVRAAGAFRQEPGCPPWSESALGPERLQRLCHDECYNPADERLAIRHIEVVRIRPQIREDEELSPLIEDVWQRFDCPPDPLGCRVEFEDPNFGQDGRNVVYYVRAIQEPTPAVNAGGLRCDEDGRCDPCYGNYRTPFEDDCLSENEERAWSSPIYVHYDAAAAMPVPAEPTPDIEVTP